VKIKISISRTKETKNLELDAGTKVQDALKKLNLKPDTIVVMSKNKPIPIDDELKDGEELVIIQVSSGG
jgi:sulfur carrier protein ThiS